MPDWPLRGKTFPLPRKRHHSPGAAPALAGPGRWMSHLWDLHGERLPSGGHRDKWQAGTTIPPVHPLAAYMSHLIIQGIYPKAAGDLLPSAPASFQRSNQLAAHLDALFMGHHQILKSRVIDISFVYSRTFSLVNCSSLWTLFAGMPQGLTICLAV